MFISCLAFAAVIFTGPLAADTILLKNGRSITNVKVSLTRKYVVARFSSGRRVYYRKTSVKTVRRRPVRWPAAVKKEPPVPAAVKKAEKPPVDKPVAKPAAVKNTPREKPAKVAAKRPVEKTGWNNPIWRSVALPGLGQFNQGRTFMGIVFVAGTAALAGGIASEYDRYTSAQNDYSASSRLVGISAFAPSGIRAPLFYYAALNQNAARGRANQAASGFFVGAGAMALFFTWNVLDVSFMGGQSRMQFGPGRNGIRFAWTVNFQ